MFKIILTALVMSLSVSTFAGDAKSDLFSKDLGSEVAFEKIDGIQDFTFYNNSSQSICVLNVSPSYSDNWEENILSSAVYTGESRRITMNGYDSHCAFDVRAVSCAGAKVTRRLDLCTTSSWTVY